MSQGRARQWAHAIGEYVHASFGSPRAPTSRPQCAQLSTISMYPRSSPQHMSFSFSSRRARPGDDREVGGLGDSRCAAVPPWRRTDRSPMRPTFRSGRGDSAKRSELGAERREVGARRQPGQRSMQTRRDGARNERRTGRGDSRALKEQGADPDPFPAGLKGAGPLRRLVVAHPSLRAFAPLGPRSVWLRRPRIGVLPAVRLGVFLSSSRSLSFSSPVRLLLVFAPLSWLAPLARWSVLFAGSFRSRCPSSAPPSCPSASRVRSVVCSASSSLDCVVLPGVPSCLSVSSSAPRPVRDRHVIPSSAIVPLRVHLSTASCPDPRSPVPGTSPPSRRSSSRPDRHPAEGVSVRRIDVGPRHSYRSAVRVQCVPRIVAPRAAVRPAVSVRIALRCGADSRQHRGCAARRTLMRPRARRGTTVPTPHRRSRAIRVCPETDRAKPIRSRAGPLCGTEDR